MTDGQKSDFISNGRSVATAFIQTINSLKALNSQSTAVDAFNQITDEDFQGANAGITKDQFFNFISLVDTILANLPPGANTTLYEVIN